MTENEMNKGFELLAKTMGVLAGAVSVIAQNQTQQPEAIAQPGYNYPSLIQLRCSTPHTDAFVLAECSPNGLFVGRR